MLFMFSPDCTDCLSSTRPQLPLIPRDFRPFMLSKLFILELWIVVRSSSVSGNVLLSIPFHNEQSFSSSLLSRKPNKRTHLVCSRYLFFVTLGQSDLCSVVDQLWIGRQSTNFPCSHSDVNKFDYVADLSVEDKLLIFAMFVARRAEDLQHQHGI